jgi:predicted Zn-dependent peptidase
MSQLFGGGMSSRLFQEVREKRGLVYSINSFATSFNDTGVFGIYAGTGEDEVAEMMPVICEELARLPHDLDDQEVYRAAVQLKAGTMMSREKTSARCEQLANQVLIFDRPISVAEVVAKIDAVTPDDIRRVTRRYLQSAPTLVSLGPVGHVMAYDKLRSYFA